MDGEITDCPHSGKKAAQDKLMAPRARPHPKNMPARNAVSPISAVVNDNSTMFINLTDVVLARLPRPIPWQARAQTHCSLHE